MIDGYFHEPVGMCVSECAALRCFKRLRLSVALTKRVTTYAKQISSAKQRAQQDGLVKAWADTSAHNSSIKEATAKGFDLIYMIPGQTAAHFARSAITMTDNSNGNNSSTTTTTLTAEETRRRRALMTEQGKIKKMIATLEAFNGNHFVTVNKDHVTTGAGARIMTTRPATGNSGDMTVGRRTPRAFVSLSAQQITLLKQSYEQLKASVYVSLLKQTRLKTYSDKVSVTVNKKGHLALDFTALNTLLTTRRSKKSVETLGDLIELARYLGPALAAEGWDGFATLKTWVSEADGKTAQEKVLTDLHVKSGNANANGTDKAEIFYDGSNGSTINAGGGNDRLNGEGLAMPPLWAWRRKLEFSPPSFMNRKFCMQREGRMPVAARRRPESSGFDYTFPRSGNDNRREPGKVGVRTSIPAAPFLDSSAACSRRRSTTSAACSRRGSTTCIHAGVHPCRRASAGMTQWQK